MKKILVWLLVLYLVTAMTWIMVRPRAGPGYPTAAVTAVLESVTTASGAEIVEKRAVSGSLRSQTRDIASLQMGIDRSLGRPVFDSMAQFRIEQGTSKVWVQFDHSATETGRIQITPDAGTAAFAVDLKSALLKAFPDIRCEITTP
jgi:hypothetical protein